MQTLDLRGTRPTRSEFAHLVPRAQVDVAVASEAAAELIAAVRERGEDALLEQSERFDRVRPTSVRVAPDAIAAALETLDPAVRTALEESIRRVREASAAQVPPDRTTTLGDGAEVVQRWQPMNRVGLYVPGGKAVYPSSVVMNVVPAQIAGVRGIALASPAQADSGGLPNPAILAAAALLGVDEVYAMGGAGAIGAFAYGVPGIDLEPVDLVTGPGNIFVAAAKRLVRGVVGIDAEAGPTEILVIADGSADARLVAADLISQAEHDEIAAAVLVTDAPDLARAVVAELDRRLAATQHRARATTALDGRQSAIVLVDDIATAAAFSDAYGPEHLEIQTADPEATLALVSNAGAVFLGANAPVSLGDYLAGSNHVLPTAGQSRFSSGLSASTFLRPQQVVRYDRAGLAAVRAHVRALSNAEQLPAHGDAVDARFPANG
ncbi:histidinol dehydrogenase [Pseudolysinimonas sp.]|uniref:histidinol dehydrogenase n=1 Tax=Pseudolysinimonas sp. TaxID=2680009 RepID=UPI003F7F436E